MKTRQHSRVWQLQEAKAKFSELVRRAMAGKPQTVTYRGKDAVVIVSAETFRTRTQQGDAFKTALFNGPPLDELALERSAQRSREVDL